MKNRHQQILKLAVPSIVSNITVPLLGLVDVAIVGHIGDASYIGAIAIGTMLFNVVYWLFGFLRMGTSGMTSQALGRRDLAETIRLLVRVLVIGCGMGMLFVLLQCPLIRGGLWLMKPEENVMGLASMYCSICVWGAPAVLGLYGFNGWFVGMQNTRIPMVVSIVQNIVNILVSLALVFVFRLGVEGVALGTVVAQWCGFGMAVLMGHIGYHRLMRHRWQDGLFDKGAMKRFFAVNRDIFLRTVCLVAVNLFFTAAGSREGTLLLAVNTLLLTLFTIYSYFMDGFAYAAEALSGKYYGAGNREAFSETVRDVFKWGGAMIVVFTLLYMIGGRHFLGLLTSDCRVIAASEAYFGWAVAIPAVGMSAFLFDGIFVGMTRSRSMLVSTGVSALVFFMLFWGFHSLMGNHALWMSFVSYLGVRGLVLWLVYMRRIRH